MVISGVTYLLLSQKSKVNDLRKKQNQAPYKPNPDISTGDQSGPTYNNLPPPVDIHELPLEEPIKPDNPIDVLPNLSPSKPYESEEEIKKEFIKLMGEEFWKNFEPILTATHYIETSIPHPPRNLQEFITKFEERAKFTNQEIFPSPVVNFSGDFFDQYLSPLIERKKLHNSACGWKRKADNSLDWINYKKKLKEPALMVLKSQEGYETMKKFVKEKLNPYLQNFIASFPKIDSLTEFNQWLNEYTNSMSIGEVLMEMCLQMAQSLGENFKWNEPFYKSFSVNSQALGKFKINFYIFDFSVN